MQAKPHGQKYELQDMSFMNVGFGKLAWDCVRRIVYDKQAAVAFIHSNTLAPKRLYSNFCPNWSIQKPLLCHGQVKAACCTAVVRRYLKHAGRESIGLAQDLLSLPKLVY